MKVTIIAEAGVNHNGSIDLAHKLIDAAVASGADYIKFQTFKTELNISQIANKAKYQIENTKSETESQFDMVKKLELSFDNFLKLKIYCDRMNIGFLSTGFDNPSIDFLNDIGQDFFKIPSGEITNKPFLKHIAKKGKPIVMSTGMANLGEIEDALAVLLDQGIERDKITVLHCNTEYPTPMEDVNLLAMHTITEAFKVRVGYSDHTKGIEVPIAAVALGAAVIEKHFTLDRNMEGPDHKASLEPNELKAMVNAIRNIEKAISGNGIKETSKSEIKNKSIARKSIHLAKALKAGDFIMEGDIIMKRPGDGISPMLIDRIIGREIIRDLDEDHKIEWRDFS